MDYFFTLVIPTYNPGQYLPQLLTSIADSKCTNEIEILIVDDCSTESFDNILNDFNNLQIKILLNDKHYGYPRNGRQKGLEAATGQWICFADQDDAFLPKAFDKVKTYIMENKITNYLATPFIMRCGDEGILYDAYRGWTHGKFYERIFCERHHLRYADIQYCEDTSLQTRLSCILLQEDISENVMNEPVYLWQRHAGSLSDKEYFLLSMPDYIKATLEIILEYVEISVNDERKFKILYTKFLLTLLHSFFYLQTEIFVNNTKQTLEAILCLLPLMKQFKSITKFTNEDIIQMMNTQLCNDYNETRAGDLLQVSFIEQISFKDWLNLYFK